MEGCIKDRLGFYSYMASKQLDLGNHNYSCLFKDTNANLTLSHHIVNQNVKGVAMIEPEIEFSVKLWNTRK